MSKPKRKRRSSATFTHSPISSAKPWKRSRRRSDPILEAGRRAWFDWCDLHEQNLLERLERALPDGADDSEPWWIQILTTDPAYIPEQRKSHCECLMALPAEPGSKPDWSAILKTAEAIYGKKAEEAGSEGFLRLYSSPNFKDGDDLAQEAICSGRALRTLPTYSFNSFFGGPEKLGFDRRRAKRRRGSSPSQSFKSRYGSFAQDLWAAGKSSNDEPDFPEWAEAAHALAESLLANGAFFATRCPGFFAKHPSAMDDGSNESMEAIDRLRLDELRGRKDIAEAAGSSCRNNAPSPARRSSI